MSGYRAKRDSAIAAKDSAAPSKLPFPRECARFAWFGAQSESAQTSSSAPRSTPTSEANTLSQWQWAAPSASHPRKHTTESTRLPSRTAHIRTSADLPSQRVRVSQSGSTTAQVADQRPRGASTQSSADVRSQRVRVSQPLTTAQVVDRRPRATLTQSSAAVSSSARAATNTPALHHRVSFDPKMRSSPTTAQPSHRRIVSDPLATIKAQSSSTTARTIHRRIVSDPQTTMEAYSSPTTAQTKMPALHHRVSFDPKAHSPPRTAQTTHRRIVSDPQTMINAHSSSTKTQTIHRRIVSDPQKTATGLATSTPHSAHLQPPTRRPPHQTRAHTSLTPQYSCRLHGLSPEAWTSCPRRQPTFPLATALEQPYASLPPLPVAAAARDACPAPPSFRYPRPRGTTAAHQNAMVLHVSDTGLGSAIQSSLPLDIRTRDASTQTDAEVVAARPGGDQTLREPRPSFLRRARIVQETMSGLRRRLSGSLRGEGRPSVEKNDCGRASSRARGARAGRKTETETGSIDEAVDHGAGKRWRGLTNAGPGDPEAYSSEKAERRQDASEELEEKIGEGKAEKLEEEKIEEGGGDTKTSSRDDMDESETDDTAAQGIPDLPVPADVLAAGTSARLRRYHSLRVSARCIDTSSLGLTERVPAALATYTHANSSNTFASDRSTVLRRRMSCCDVEDRIAALASLTDISYLQLRVKEDGREGGENRVRQWRARVARLEIEVDRMIAGGLLDQFEGLVERLHILEDERKAFPSL